MREFIRRNAKLIGVLLGVLQGLAQGLTIEGANVFHTFSLQTLIIIIVFGFCVPLIIALFHTASKMVFGGSLMRKINEYVHLYSMMIVGSLVLGLSGWITLHNQGIDDGRVVLCAFFASNGIGFFIAYFIDDQLGRRAENKAGQGN